MTFFKRPLLSISFLLCCCFAARSQNLDASIAAWSSTYPAERTYIHYDKASYFAGETVWFKAYMMTEISPANDSKTLYIDWIDDKGGLMMHSVSPIVDGVTNGQFEIPVDYRGKFIHVRAYTKWMLNFDSAFLYNKNIRMLTRDMPQTVGKSLPVPALAFFPEGGDAVAGISNKIAFKANDQWGRPVGVKGVIVASDGKTQDSLRTIHDGMGYFYLVPQPGMKYSAKWKDEKNVEHTTALPAIKDNGISMQVAIAHTNRILTIYYTQPFASANDSLKIVGTMYQREAFNISRATDGPFIKATIPVSSLPSGILTITVFDKRWNALAERITFVDNGEYTFQPTLEVQHWGLNKRARNEIKITIPDSISANMSVAVTDASIGTDSSSNIISHLLLTSELKGDVYNPAYYFSDRSELISQHLDLVMLTNGWRRFKWEQVIAGKIPKPRFERDTAYLSLSGRLYGVTHSQIRPGSNIILLVQLKDQKPGFMLIPIQPNGTFSEPGVIIFDTAHIYYQFEKSKGLGDASVEFMPDRLPAPSLQALSTAQASIVWLDTTGALRQMNLAIEANDVAQGLKVKTLENVTVKSRTKTPLQQMDEKYTSGLFIGDGFQFDLVNDPTAMGMMNIFNYLQGKVAGLTVNTSSSPPTLSWRGGAPQLFLDEVPTDPDFISSLSINDVAYIKVFRPPFMGGFNGGNGAIAIYTRRGNDVKATPGKGLNNNKVFGYTLIKEFYSPNYSSFKQSNEQRDVRTTLYWNPAVAASPSKREVVLTFYNNDVTNAFRVVIEGMTRDGQMTHLEQIIE